MACPFDTEVGFHHAGFPLCFNIQKIIIAYVYSLLIKKLFISEVPTNNEKILFQKLLPYVTRLENLYDRAFSPVGPTYITSYGCCIGSGNTPFRVILVPYYIPHLSTK